MCSVLMFGTIRCIRESFCASSKFTHVRSLSSMRADMRFQILQTRVAFIASTVLRERERTNNWLNLASYVHSVYTPFKFWNPGVEDVYP